MNDARTFRKAIKKAAPKLVLVSMMIFVAWISGQIAFAQTSNTPKQSDSASRNDTDLSPFNGEPYSSSTKWNRFIAFIRHQRRSLSFKEVETGFGDRLIRAGTTNIPGLQYSDSNLRIFFGVDRAAAAKQKPHWLSIGFSYFPLSSPGQCVPREKALSDLRSIGFSELPGPPLTTSADGSFGLPLPDTVKLARRTERVSAHFGLVGEPDPCLHDVDFTGQV